MKRIHYIRREEPSIKKINSIKEILKLVAKNFFAHNVGKSGAALAYYMLFALFPLLIFISNVLGQLDLNVNYITDSLSTVLPKTMIELLGNYLNYVSANSSGSLLSLSLILTIYFPIRATKSLIFDVRCAYGLGEPSKKLSFTVKRWLFTFMLFVVIVIAVILSSLSQSVISFAIDKIPWLDRMNLPDLPITIWHYSRFPALALVMFIASGTLYGISQDGKPKMSSVIPGALIASAAWLAASMCISFYVENFDQYSLIYGTLGTVIVLLLWLYVTAVILILGAEFNNAIKEHRR